MINNFFEKKVAFIKTRY